MYELRAPGAAPWRSGLDTAAAAHRLLAAAPPGVEVLRERDGVRVGPSGALMPDRWHLEAVLAAMPGDEGTIAAETGLPADLTMAALAELRRQGRAAWAGWCWETARARVA